MGKLVGYTACIAKSTKPNRVQAEHSHFLDFPVI